MFVLLIVERSGTWGILRRHARDETLSSGIVFVDGKKRTHSKLRDSLHEAEAGLKLTAFFVTPFDRQRFPSSARVAHAPLSHE
jgi:hypothetical protein